MDSSQRLTFDELEFNNKVNAHILDCHNAEITIDEKAKKVVLYHGTRAPLEKVLKEGLLIRAGLKGAGTKMQMIDEVLNGEFGVTREDVPEWVWIYEYDYEKTIEPHLHMSINLGTAVGYSHQGCEIKAQIRRNMFNWLLSRRYGDFSAKEFEEKLFPGREYGIVSQIACQRNGEKSYVLQVEIPRNFLRREDTKFWKEVVEKVKQLAITDPEIEPFKTLKDTTMEIRCLKNVPPSMFRKIWRVQWATAWGWISGNYELVNIPFSLCIG